MRKHLNGLPEFKFNPNEPSPDAICNATPFLISYLLLPIIKPFSSHTLGVQKVECDGRVEQLLGLRIGVWPDRALKAESPSLRRYHKTEQPRPPLNTKISRLNTSIAQNEHNPTTILKR